MPRIIAGAAGGRRLKAPPGQGTRPTSDRVKEALFSSLGDLTGLRVLDLYAGSGGLAIESLSRGAAAAVLVEQDRRTAQVITANLATADVTDRARLVVCPVAAFCDKPIGGPFDLVIADPPYAIPITTIAEELDSLARAGAVRTGTRIVLERDRRTPEPVPGLLEHDRDRAYGDTVLRFFTYRPSGPAAHDGADQI